MIFLVYKKGEGAMSKALKCPVCNWRLMDLLEIDAQKLILEYKCPKCRNILAIILGNDYKIKIKKKNIPSK